MKARLQKFKLKLKKTFKPDFVYQDEENKYTNRGVDLSIKDDDYISDDEDLKTAKRRTVGQDKLFTPRRVLDMHTDSIMQQQESTPIASGKFFENISELSEQLRLAARDKTYSDVILRVGNPFQKIFAHKFILANRSEYFKALFHSSDQFDDCEKLVIDIPDIIFVDVFNKVIDYLYSGSIRLEREDVLEVLAIADRLQVKSLKEICASYCQQNIDAENACTLFELGKQYNVPLLEQIAVKFIDRYISKGILQSHSWNNLAEANLLFILKRNELHLEESQEVQLFQAVLNWAKKQVRGPYETMEADSITQVEEPNKLATIASKALELIRYPLISSSDLSLIVEPSGVVPQTFLFEAYKYHLLMNNKPEISNNIRFCKRAGPYVSTTLSTPRLPLTPIKEVKVETKLLVESSTTNETLSKKLSKKQLSSMGSFKENVNILSMRE